MPENEIDLYNEGSSVSGAIYRYVFSSKIGLNLLGATWIPTLSAGKVTAILVCPTDAILTTSAVGVVDSSGTVSPEGIVVPVVRACLRRCDRLTLREIARHITRQGQGARNRKEAKGQRRERHHLDHKPW